MNGAIGPGPKKNGPKFATDPSVEDFGCRAAMSEEHYIKTGSYSIFWYKTLRNNFALCQWVDMCRKSLFQANNLQNRRRRAAWHHPFL